MTTPQTAPRASFGIRFGIFCLVVLLTILFIWLIGFFLRDIRRIEGPDYAQIEREFVDPALVAQQQSLAEELRQIDGRIGRQQEIESTADAKTATAKQTMNQIIELHRLSLEQGQPPSAEEQALLTKAQSQFLEAQAEVERAQAARTDLEAQRDDLTRQREAVDNQLETQRKPASARYGELRRKHNVKLAALQLAIVVPIFLLAAWLYQRGRKSMYRPILLAILLAGAWHIIEVIHEYFPTELFKYIAIAAAIAVTLGFLAHLLRVAVHPRVEDRLKRAREAYNQRRCAVCGFPIRRGPWRHAVWTGKGPKIAMALAAETNEPADKPYHCPSCGTQLYEACDQCGATRHSLLPVCESCGAHKPEASEALGDGVPPDERKD
jgi:hypothetical protein